MSNSFWSEIKVEIPAAYGEIIAEIFQEEGSGGVIYEDPAILADCPCQADEYLGTEVLKTAPQKYGVKAYFPVDDLLGTRLVKLKERMSRILGYVPDFTLTQVQEEDWAEAWKTYFKPERIGKIVVKPSWESYEPLSGETIIELDPGMAFGTGTHPTTRLCILLLQEIVLLPEMASPDISMLDIGTGSGILGLAGARLGIPEILATDIDPVAVRVATENVRRNKLEAVIKVSAGDLLHRRPDSKFTLIVANIITDAILKLIPELDGGLKPGGWFLASGIIAERGPEVTAALAGHGFTPVKILTEQGWLGILAVNGSARGGGVSGQ